MSRAYWKEFIPKSWILCKKYSPKLFKADLLAGITVGIVALPLSMAFAIASGVTPDRGLYTAIIAGFLISLFGGSRVQIGGPTGAFVVIIYAIIQRSGYAGLVAATLLASLILLISAFSRLGSLIKYIPYPLITGFTTGIALIIFSSQMKDFFGLQMASVPAHFLPKWHAIFTAFPTLHLPTFLLALGTLLLIILIRRYIPTLPWGITAVLFSSLVSWGLGLPVETIFMRFGEIPRSLPLPTLPVLEAINWKFVIPDGITIAFLAGIESLLSAVIADGMLGTRHKSNCELMAQGIANFGSLCFGGIPATGAIARTATNIKSGAKTPIAGMVHALTLFLILVIFAPLVSQIPLAVLSAVLIMVAWNMSELESFRHLFKAPKSDIAVLLITFILTVLIDLTIAVGVGMLVAFLLFIKKRKTYARALSLREMDRIYSEDTEEIEKREYPPGVEVFEIMGPFFFGAADSLKHILTNLEPSPKCFILRMRKVPFIDATGLHVLEEFCFRCKKEKTRLILTGVKEPVYNSLKKFGLVKKIGEENICPNLTSALQRFSKTE